MFDLPEHGKAEPKEEHKLESVVKWKPIDDTDQAFNHTAAIKY